MRIILAGCVLLFIPLLASADEIQPIQALQIGVEKGVRILSDSKYKDPDQEEDAQKQLIEILGQLFDFQEFSRRVLAARWKTFTPSQQETFVRVFTEFLSKYYIGKILEKYKDERVIYRSQTLESPTRAHVKVEVVWKGQPIPVDLPMIQRKGKWKVYEIQVLGISAVSFYRAQFKSLLRKETPDQVIERIKRRINKID